MVRCHWWTGLAFKDAKIEQEYSKKMQGYILIDFERNSLQMILVILIMIGVKASTPTEFWATNIILPFVCILTILLSFCVGYFFKNWLEILSVVTNVFSNITLVEFVLGYGSSSLFEIFFLGWSVCRLQYESFSNVKNIFMKGLLGGIINTYACLRIGFSINILITLFIFFVFCKVINGFLEEKIKRESFTDYYKQLKNMEYYKYILDKGIRSGAAIFSLKKEKNNRGDDKLESKFENPYLNFSSKKMFKIVQEAEIFEILRLIPCNGNHSINNSIPHSANSRSAEAVHHSCFLKKIVRELEKAENLRSEDMLLSKSWKETLIFDRPGVSLKLADHEVNFDLIASKFIWNEQASVIVIFNDISDKVLSQRLDELNHHKDHLLASVSHELKTPLHAIFGYTTELISKNFPDDVMEFLYQIKINSKLLQYQIDNILDYSKMTQNQLVISSVKFHLTKLLSQVKSLVFYSIEQKGLNIEFSVDPSCPNTINSDPHRIKQLLMILISNAIKFTFDGKIELKINKVDENLLKFEVSDTGIGISEEKKKNLFTLFSSTIKNKYETYQHGIGFGLSLSKYFIDKLGPPQQIIINSNLNQGSCFSFTIYIDNSKIDKPEEKNGNINLVNTLINRKMSKVGFSQTILHANKFNHSELTPVIEKRFFAGESLKKVASNDFGSLSPLSLKKNNLSNFSITKIPPERNPTNNTENEELLVIEEEEFTTNRQLPRIFFGPSRSIEESSPSKIEKKNAYVKAITHLKSYSSLGDQTPTLSAKEKEKIIKERKYSESDSLHELDHFNVKYNFLIVDDTPLNLLILETFILSQNKCNKITKAYNGQQAVDIMKANSEQFDLIFMDLNMPILNGYQASSQIKELMREGKTGKCPILAISAYSKVTDDNRWKECGMDDFIEKPLTKNKFTEIYKYWLDKN